jgi:hypothetical protein
VRAVDAVEASRGFEPPFFADIRIHRSVRAVGFRGPAFGRLLGEERYRWMKALGNTSKVTGRGHHEIADPKAAESLLDLALRAAERRQRVIFFAAASWPAGKGRTPAIDRRSRGWFCEQRNDAAWTSRSSSGGAASRGSEAWR